MISPPVVKSPPATMATIITDLAADGYYLVALKYPHVRSIYHEARILAPTALKVETFLNANPSYTRAYTEMDGSLTLTSYLDPEKVTLPSGPANIKRLCELVNLKPAPYGENRLTPEYQMDGCFEGGTVTVLGGGGPGHEEFDAKLIEDAIRSSCSRFTHLCYSVEGGKYLYHLGSTSSPTRSPLRVSGGSTKPKCVGSPISLVSSFKHQRDTLEAKEKLIEKARRMVADLCDEMGDFCTGAPDIYTAYNISEKLYALEKLLNEKTT